MAEKTKRSFRGKILDAGGGGAYVEVPFDVEKAYGKKRVKVKVTIDGKPYRGSMVRMGGPCHIIPAPKAIRETLGKGIGDVVAVTVEEDTAPRTVSVPADFRRAMDANPAAKDFFRGLAYTHRREYVRWVVDAKQAETRRRRIDRAVKMLQATKKER